VQSDNKNITNKKLKVLAKNKFHWECYWGYA